MCRMELCINFYFYSALTFRYGEEMEQKKRKMRKMYIDMITAIRTKYRWLMMASKSDMTKQLVIINK